MGRPSVVVEPRCQGSEFTLNERPFFPTRWRRADLWGRVNGNLRLRFGHGGVTSYAGLEVVRRDFDALRLLRLGGGGPGPPRPAPTSGWHPLCVRSLGRRLPGGG